MKVVIAGSRRCTSVHDHYQLVVWAVRDALQEFRRTLDQDFEITEVGSGAAPGIDTLGEKWAAEQGLPVTRFPADWDKYGRAAGPIRNGEMAKWLDALIAIRYPNSKGTNNMIKRTQALGKPIHIFEILTP